MNATRDIDRTIPYVCLSVSRWQSWLTIRPMCCEACKSFVKPRPHRRKNALSNADVRLFIRVSVCLSVANAFATSTLSRHFGIRRRFSRDTQQSIDRGGAYRLDQWGRSICYRVDQDKTWWQATQHQSYTVFRKKTPTHIFCHISMSDV